MSRVPRIRARAFAASVFPTLRALDEERPAELESKREGGRERIIGEVAGAREPFLDVGDLAHFLIPSPGGSGQAKRCSTFTCEVICPQSSYRRGPGSMFVRVRTAVDRTVTRRGGSRLSPGTTVSRAHAASLGRQLEVLCRLPDPEVVVRHLGMDEAQMSAKTSLTAFEKADTPPTLGLSPTPLAPIG